MSERNSFSGLALRVFAFMEEWERQRRTLADWLREPEAAWCPGFAEEDHDGYSEYDPHAYLWPTDPNGSRNGDLDGSRDGDIS